MNIDSIKNGLVIDHIRSGGAMRIYDLLGLGSLDCTVNIIRDGSISEKRHMALPEKLVNVIRCRNPRCITTIEQELPHIFKLTGGKKRVYRCIYCESRA